MKSIPKIFRCLIVFQFPDRNLTKKICSTLCLFGFRITADFGNFKHALLHTQSQIDSVITMLLD